MSFFDRHMAAVLAARGAPATYGGTGCRAIRQGGGQAIMVGPLRVIVDRTTFHVRRAEVAAPVEGGTLVVDGTSYTVEAVQPVERDVDQLLWQLEVAWGATVTWRSLTGSGSAVNPPQAVAPKVDANAAMGATSIAISSATLLFGRVVAGDKFTIAGDATEYTISGPITAAPVSPTGGKLTAVPFAPALVVAADAGDAVTFDFLRDYSVRAAVAGYQAEEYQGGIQAGDRRLVILESALDAAGMSDPPKAPDQVTLEGRTFTVRSATALYRDGVPYAWDVQVRA